MDVRLILQSDCEEMTEGLAAFAAYSFCQDLNARMGSSLSSSALGARCGVSHTIVDKWRKGAAKPNGKERMKELALALGMNLRELNDFLYRNGYPKLYDKNPLDVACKLVLFSAPADPVESYRATLERYGLSAFETVRNHDSLATCMMSEALHRAAEMGQVSLWFEENRDAFRGDAKNLLLDMRIVRLLLLYLGDAAVREMYLTGELPVTLKNLLYPMRAGKAVSVRGLREKLIAFGLYANMTEEEIDSLLALVKLRLFTEPESRLDYVLLNAVRMGHERYPLYEAENLERVLKRLSAAKDTYADVLLPQYRERLALAQNLSAYYEKTERSIEELCFEQTYTSFADRGLMDYIRDVLLWLREQGSLSWDEIKPIAELIERNEEGKSLWS